MRLRFIQRFHSKLLGLFICLTVPASPANAADVSLRDLLANTKPGSEIRVAMNDSLRVTGRLNFFEPDTLQLQNPIQSIPITQVDSLWVKGNEIGRISLIFGILGGVVGAGIGYSYCHWSRAELADPEPAYDCAIGGGLVGGLVGALLGVGIGMVTPAWHLRYTAEEK